MRRNEIEGKRRTEMERTFLRLWLAVFVCVLCRVDYRVSGLYRAIALTGTGSTKQTLCSVAFSSLLSYAFYLNLFEVGTHEKKTTKFRFHLINKIIKFHIKFSCAFRVFDIFCPRETINSGQSVSN